VKIVDKFDLEKNSECNVFVLRADKNKEPIYGVKCCFKMCVELQWMTWKSARQRRRSVTRVVLLIGRAVASLTTTVARCSSATWTTPLRPTSSAKFSPRYGGADFFQTPLLKYLFTFIY